MDNGLRDRIVVGTSDELALQRLLEEKDLTLQKAIDICRSTENAAKNSAVIRGRSVGKVSQYKRNMQRAPPASSNRARFSLDGDELCPKCGRGKHIGDQKCKAINAACNNCGKTGHFAVVCKARSCTPATWRRAAPPQDVSTRQRKLHRVIADVYQGKENRRRTPHIKIVTTHPGGQGRISWTPDSGAEATVMGWDVARAAGIKQAALEAVTGEALYAAGQQQLNCLGKFTSTLELGDRKTSAEVIVVEELKGALLSWYDSIALGFLPPNFLTQIQKQLNKVTAVHSSMSVLWQQTHCPSGNITMSLHQQKEQDMPQPSSMLFRECLALRRP